MRRKHMLTGLGVVTTAAIVVAGSLAIVARAANPNAAQAQYSVPFICGWLPPVTPQNDVHAKPGDYATAINIHNHTNSSVMGSWRMAIHYRRTTAPPPVIPFQNFSSQTRRVLEVDCVDLWGQAGLPPGTFIKGAVHIGLATPLPVAAIYTSQTHNDPGLGPDPGAGHSIDIEQIVPFQLGVAG